MIRTLIIDDEESAINVVKLLLQKYVPEVDEIYTAVGATEGIMAINQCKPQLVFLDIEMPLLNGFQLLEQFPGHSFDIIFMTAYDQYAIKAIRFSALDYLLKPIDREELKKAVQKVSQRQQPPLPQQLEILLQKLNQPVQSGLRIAIPTMEGLQMIQIDSIISCAADSNYTNLHLKNKQKITASRTLKDIEEMLEGRSFFRVHHSHLVNLNEIHKYVKGEGGYLIMSDDSTIDVSRSRKELLLQKLQPNRLS